MIETRWIAFALLAGCAGSSGTAKPSPTEARPIVTAGNRCSGGVCTCRAVDDYGRSLGPAFDEGAPAPGTKRFELRTGRGEDALTVTVERLGAFEKSLRSVEPSCAYVDLPPGKHRVTVHARAANEEAGQQPGLFIREYSAQKNSWYDTFQFRCGSGSELCSLGHMEQFLAEAQKVPRGVWDPCGSVRVEGIRWDGGRGPGSKLSELTLELVLEVYKFEPRFPHGAPTCKGPSPSAEP
jgi:hypothetical protein